MYPLRHNPYCSEDDTQFTPKSFAKVIGVVSNFYSTRRLLAKKRLAKQTKRPPGNRVAFSFQGRIVPTEAKNSVKTFWTKSYEPKKGGVKQFLVNKCLWFQ